MKRNICILIAIMTASVASCNDGIEKWDPSSSQYGSTGNETTETVVLHERAYETYSAILSNYLVRTGATQGFLNENAPKEDGDGAASFLWTYDGFISGVAALNKLGYDVDYTSWVDGFQAYFRDDSSVSIPGFGSSTDGTNGSGDRYYDDNSIVGIELVEAYNQTGESKYLDLCAKIVSFLDSGRDDVFGGALWWCESYKNISGYDSSNKPACANGYAAWFLLKYYEVCPESEKSFVLEFAEELYDWLYNNLRDTDDNLYWNSMGADGTINKTKWTYNSGAMIASGVRLYEITGEQDYIKQARSTAASSYSYFVNSSNASGLSLSYPTNDPWFTIQLIKSYIELEPYYSSVSTYLDVFEMYLEYAWDYGRMDSGLFYEDWTGTTINHERDKSLLMQDAALESLAIMALYNGETAVTE